MTIFNTKEKYGALAIVLHWGMAFLVVAMYFLGEYMVDLEYYDRWYHQAPWIHKSVGLCLFFLLILRFAIRRYPSKVEPLRTHKKWEVNAAISIHYLFYLILSLTLVSGYLVATAKGVGIEVFSLIEFPAMMSLEEGQADFFAEVHEVGTKLLVLLFFVHVMAALKHHFWDHDSTLKRMLGK